MLIFKPKTFVERNVFIDITDILFNCSTGIWHYSLLLGMSKTVFLMKKVGRGGMRAAFAISHRNKSEMAGGFRWHECGISNVFLEPPHCSDLMQDGR